MKYPDFVGLVRPLNCFMAGIASMAGYFVGKSFFAFDLNYVFSFLSVFFVCAGGQAINDYFDFEIDKKKGKTLFLEKQKKTVFFYAITLFFIGIIFSLFLSFLSFLIALIFSLLLFVYSAFFKKAKFLGNYVVAMGTAFSIIFGAVTTQNLFFPVLFAVSAFFANSSRELLKDLEDKKVDLSQKRSLPMLLPKKTVLIITFVYTLAAIFFSFIPFYLQLAGKIYLFLVIVSWIGFFYSVFLGFKSEYALAQKTSKIAMLVALTGFISFSF